MYGKVILSLALIAFVSVPCAYSLQCYQCFEPVQCTSLSLTLVECDQTRANVTRGYLQSQYQQVQVLNGTDFSCYTGIYKANNTIVAAVRGCINTGTVTCNSPLMNTTWIKDTCDVCKSDKCNKQNSVGTFSSSIVTMIALMFLAKFFVV